MKIFCGLLLFFSQVFAAILALPSEESIEFAKAILDEHPVIDGHNDFPMALRAILQNDLREFNFDSNLLNDSRWDPFKALNHVDLPRIRQGRLGGQVSSKNPLDLFLLFESFGSFKTACWSSSPY